MLCSYTHGVKIWYRNNFEVKSQIISEMLPEFHTMETCYFLKRIIHSQIMQVCVKFEAILTKLDLVVCRYHEQESLGHTCIT